MQSFFHWWAVSGVKDGSSNAKIMMILNCVKTPLHVSKINTVEPQSFGPNKPPPYPNLSRDIKFLEKLCNLLLNTSSIYLNY